MKISIIGTGYVGLVTGACLSELGNEVICVDCDRGKIKGLKKGIMPIYEPGLEELLKRNLKKGRIKFSTSIKQAVTDTRIIFIAVSTPSKENGEADLTGVENVARQIAESMPSYRLIVEKSTVPVETGKWVQRTIKVFNKKNLDFDVASNPEFLREGSAVEDFMHPDRIVLGVESKRAEELLLKLYKPLGAPIVVTDINSAEIIKHASNSYLASRISFINAIACICEKVGADVVKVAEGMGLDKRIGKRFLNAGLGFGGPCLQKDLDAFIKIADRAGYNFEILKAVKRVNLVQRQLLFKKVQEALWVLSDKTIGILGLAFKPGTDDMRNAPSIEIIQALQAEGAKIKAFDPKAMEKAKRILKGVKFCQSVLETAKHSDCLIILTEWKEFKKLDFKRLKGILRQPIIVDGRNIYDPAKMRRLGFEYIGIGRSVPSV